MGGLDARELVSTLGYGDRVASLTRSQRRIAAPALQTSR
jgi:hypothetical protein